MPPTGTPLANCSASMPGNKTSPRWSVTPPTGTRPPAPTWRNRASPSPPSARQPATAAAGSPRTGSPWTWTTARSPVPPGRPPSSSPPPAAGGHRSGPGAPPAHCGRRAPRRGAGAPSPSIPKRPSSSEPAANSATQAGKIATGQTGPSWNARSPTSPAGPGAGAAPGPGGWPASPPTLPPAPQLSTGPGLPPSDLNTTRQAGRCEPPDRPDTAKTNPGTAHTPNPANPHRAGQHGAPKDHRHPAQIRPYFSTVLVRGD